METDKLKQLRKKNRQLRSALQDAKDHLEYCGYGDAWEREGHEKLKKKIDRALNTSTK